MENGYYFLKNKRTKNCIYAEYHDGDWYLPAGVKDEKYVHRYFELEKDSFCIARPKVRDEHSWDEALSYRPSARGKKEFKGGAGKAGRPSETSIYRKSVDSNTKYQHEYRLV